jgi:hypothetical protein
MVTSTLKTLNFPIAPRVIDSSLIDIKGGSALIVGLPLEETSVIKAVVVTLNQENLSTLDVVSAALNLR